MGSTNRIDLHFIQVYHRSGLKLTLGRKWLELNRGRACIWTNMVQQCSNTSAQWPHSRWSVDHATSTVTLCIASTFEELPCKGIRSALTLDYLKVTAFRLVYLHCSAHGHCCILSSVIQCHVQCTEEYDMHNAPIPYWHKPVLWSNKQGQRSHTVHWVSYTHTHY